MFYLTFGTEKISSLKKYHFLFLLLLAFLFSACSKKKLELSSKENDSLMHYFQIANEDSIPFQKRVFVAEKALKIISLQENDSMHRVHLFKLANRYFNMTNWKKFKKTAELIVDESKKSGDRSSLAKAYSYIGDYYYKTGKTDSSFIFFKKAEKIYLNQENNERLGDLYISYSRAYFLLNDYGASELMAVKALKALKNTDKASAIYDAYNMMAINSNLMRQPEQALKYHHKALAILNKSNFPEFMQSRALTYNNIGTVYQGIGNFKKAIRYYTMSLNEKNHRLNYPESYAKALDNLAYSKFLSNDFSNLPELFFESLKIKDSLNFKSGIITTNNNLSNYYLHFKDTVNAKKYASEALDLANQTKKTEDILFSLKQLALSDKKNAVKHFEKYNNLKDSIFLEERISRNRVAKIEYETEEIVLEKDKAIAQKWMVFWISISALLLTILILVSRTQQSRKRELQLVKNQQYANEEIYRLILDQQIKFEEGRQKEKKRISKELHDGIMNKLASIRLNLFVLKKKTDAKTIEDSLKYISELHNIEKEIRNISHDLSEDIYSIKDDYFSLITNLVNDFKEHDAVHFHLEIDKNINWDSINAIVKMNCYRILQESINNIVKHAKAERIVIEILKIASNIEILIKDDGCGFDEKKPVDGIGLKNIDSRIADMKATYTINSVMNEGTSIWIKIPMEPETL